VAPLDALTKEALAPPGYWLDSDDLALIDLLGSDDPVAPIRGMFSALALSIPIWGVACTAVWFLVLE
jgi:hypothetical protein